MDFSKKIDESAPFLGVPLRYFVFPTFLEEAPKLWENLLSTSAPAAEVIPPDLLGVLSSCLWINDNLAAFIWQRFCGILIVP